jgi:hypothetical protein
MLERRWVNALSWWSLDDTSSAIRLKHNYAVVHSPLYLCTICCGMTQQFYVWEDCATCLHRLRLCRKAIQEEEKFLSLCR